jgi:hypothetical protein
MPLPLRRCVFGAPSIRVLDPGSYPDAGSLAMKREEDEMRLDDDLSVD